jgi:hypothetical protein
MRSYNPARAAGHAIAALLLDPELGKVPLSGHVFSVDPALWKLDGKELVAAGNTTGNPLWFGDRSWTDYDLELEMHRSQVTAGLIVAFRGTDLGTTARVTFVAGGNLCQVHVLTAGKATFLGGCPCPMENSNWYKVNVQVRGNKVLVHLDGKRLLETTGLTIDRGQIGLCCAGPARFRTIKVTAPDGTVLFQGLPRLHQPPEGGSWPALP